MLIPFPGPNPADAAVGARLRSWRERRGVEVGALAHDMRVSAEELSRAEHGRAHLSSVQLYAATLALHIPMRLLFEDASPRGRA